MKKYNQIVLAWFWAAIFAAFLLAVDAAPAPAILGVVSALTLGMVVGYLSAPAPGTDIWRLQRYMMRVSDQETPNNPVLTPGVLLYYALQLEELAETTGTLRALMYHHNRSLPVRLQAASVLNDMRDLQRNMVSQSEYLRLLISNQSDGRWVIPLSQSQARHLFDDNMDMTVVTAGMALAAGLPAAEGYEEVQRSNMSKVDPTTGRILKDHSGKWMKGPNYTPPQLDTVLADNWHDPLDPPI